MAKVYCYVSGKFSGRKSVPRIKETEGTLITDVARANILNQFLASLFTCNDGNILYFSSRVDESVECRAVSFTPVKVM